MKRRLFLSEIPLVFYSCSNILGIDYKTGKAMQEYKKKVKNLDDVEFLMEKFIINRDFPQIDPTIEQVFEYGKGTPSGRDCNWAQVYSQWLLENINIPSRLVILIGLGGGHAITVSESNNIIVTNKLSWVENCVHKVNPADWYKTPIDWGYDEVYDKKYNESYLKEPYEWRYF